VFHSYLRRWNDFSGMPSEQEAFLEWVDKHTLITRHQLESVKVAAGKKGSVTGFTGAIEYTLSRDAAQHPEWVQLFFALGRLAPYCGTGHKTTFGLGQTRLGWLGVQESTEIPSLSTQLAQRIAELTEILMLQQKRTGGERANSVCSTRATILARHEFGESLKAIATDLEMPYETVKTYAKLARRALK
jgi:CRISPR-associated endoribonuclease Cas6